MQTPKQLGITPKQFKNIAKLTLFVKDKVAPPKFNIKYFFTRKGERYGDYGDEYCRNESDYGCGTSACFLGYGPLSGLPPKKNELWEDYGARLFGVEKVSPWSDMGGDVYDLLFSCSHVNSKSAAVKRGAWLLTNGFPENVDLTIWETPRGFKPDWAAIEKIANQ
jgi:hypothetical protein